MEKVSYIMGIAQYNSENVTMMNAERKMYFEGLGVDVTKAHDLNTAINVSGLNFEVEKLPISFSKPMPQDMGNGTSILVNVPFEIPNQFATVRTDTNEPLGIVGKQYEILQNYEAFDFLDSLVQEAKFETAGFYGPTGAKSFITMSTEPLEILGDEFAPYILFTNSHDGSGTVKAMFTPIRIFCSNCLARAMKSAQNKVSIRHKRNMKTNLEIAKSVLLAHTKYLEALKEEAEKLAVTPFSEAAFIALAKSLYPVKADDSNVVQVHNMAMVEALLKAYKKDDLSNFNDTAWKAVQAFADFESHEPVFRNTKNMKYHNIANVMNDMELTNRVANMILAGAVA